MAIENVNTIYERGSIFVRNTEFSIAICRPTGDEWQSKTLFLSIFDPRSSIVKSVSDCRLSSVVLLRQDSMSFAFLVSSSTDCFFTKRRLLGFLVVLMQFFHILLPYFWSEIIFK